MDWDIHRVPNPLLGAVDLLFWWVLTFNWPAGWQRKIPPPTDVFGSFLVKKPGSVDLEATFAIEFCPPKQSIPPPSVTMSLMTDVITLEVAGKHMTSLLVSCEDVRRPPSVG